MILPVFADQHLDARFRLFELLAADIAEPHAALEEFERALQRQVAAFQFAHHFFQFVRQVSKVSTGFASFWFSAIASF